MYTLQFYESGTFSTNLGGPVYTLAIALEQMDRFTRGVGAEPLKDIVGCQWLRNGTTPCWVIIVNDMGVPIKVKEV